MANNALKNIFFIIFIIFVYSTIRRITHYLRPLLPPPRLPPPENPPLRLLLLLGREYDPLLRDELELELGREYDPLPREELLFERLYEPLFELLPELLTLELLFLREPLVPPSIVELLVLGDDTLFRPLPVRLPDAVFIFESLLPLV